MRERVDRTLIESARYAPPVNVLKALVPRTLPKRCAAKLHRSIILTRSLSPSSSSSPFAPSPFSLVRRQILSSHSHATSFSFLRPTLACTDPTEYSHRASVLGGKGSLRDDAGRWAEFGLCRRRSEYFVRSAEGARESATRKG